MSNENKRRKTPQSCLGTFFPHAKRLRSATRRIHFEEKPPNSTNSRKNEKSHLTNVRRDDIHIFKDVPVEIAQRMFDFMDLRSLSQLAFVDNKCRELIQEYIKSKHFLTRFRALMNGERKNGDKNSIDEFFVRSAHLFKRVTMITPTEQRISCFQRFFQAVNDCDYRNQDVAQCWGLFWHRLMRGWEFLECAKTYTYLTAYGKDSIQKMVINFFNNKPGKWPENEYRLRNFFRWFVLDYSFEKSEDLGFWIATTLGEFTMYHQAKLLYLIFGPVNDQTKRIDWMKLTNVGVSWRTADNFFKKLTDSFKNLQKYSAIKWTDDTIISLIEELTSFPDGWLLENFAYLLLYCEEKITLGVLASRAINGRIDEVSFIFHSMCLCVSRSCRNMAYMFRLFCQIFAEIPTETARIQLVKSFSRQTSGRLVELYSSADGEASAGDDVSAYEKFFGLVLLMAVKSVNLNNEP